MSKFQSLVGDALRYWFPNQKLMVNHRPDWLNGLEVDFYFPALGFAVEVQGEQHRKFVPYFHKGRADFSEQLKRDKKKRLICKQRRIRLVAVRDFATLRIKLEGGLQVRLSPLPPEITSEQATHSIRLRKLALKLSPRKPVLRETHGYPF